MLKPKIMKSKLSKTMPRTPRKDEDYTAISVQEFLTEPLEDESDTDPNSKSDEESPKQLNDAEKDEVESHKKSLAKLKETDPEFYKFLEENDKKLLKFDISDDEQEDEEHKVHIPSGELEVASDESDFEADDSETLIDERAVTLKLLKKWQTDIHYDKTNGTIRNLVHAFHAALCRISNTDDDEPVQFKVEGEFRGRIKQLFVTMFILKGRPFSMP